MSHFCSFEDTLSINTAEILNVCEKEVENDEKTIECVLLPENENEPNLCHTFDKANMIMQRRKNENLALSNVVNKQSLNNIVSPLTEDRLRLVLAEFKEELLSGIFSTFGCAEQKTCLQNLNESVKETNVKNEFISKEIKKVYDFLNVTIIYIYKYIFFA